jgi:hypothetical protein
MSSCTFYVVRMPSGTVHAFLQDVYDAMCREHQSNSPKSSVYLLYSREVFVRAFDEAVGVWASSEIEAIEKSGVK